MDSRKRERGGGAANPDGCRPLHHTTVAAGGPLTADWILKRKELNLKMLARMRGLGMTPALPAFSGHVPQGFTLLFPTAKYSRSSVWSLPHSPAHLHCCWL